MYLPMLSDEEIIQYAEQSGTTPLEKELSSRLAVAVDRVVELEVELNDCVDSL